MKLTKEQLLTAKNAKSVEELAVLVKELGAEMPAADLQKTFDALKKTGELADDELDNVAGGACIENGLWGYDHPDKVCPSCGHVGMDESLYIVGGWCLSCPDCKKVFDQKSDGTLVHDPNKVRGWMS